MIKPVRLQLSRRAGFSLQELSRKTNGLRCIIVSRPHRHGNPWRVGECPDLIQAKKWGWEIPSEAREAICADQAEAVRRFSLKLAADESLHAAIRRELCGHNLACWCGLDQPCHADTLLELANP